MRSMVALSLGNQTLVSNRWPSCIPTTFLRLVAGARISLQMRKPIKQEDLVKLHQTEWTATKDCRGSKLSMSNLDEKRTA